MIKERINNGWYFWKEGDESNKTLVNLPHDAMIYEKRDISAPGGASSGFFPGGKYYYEKELDGVSDGKTIIEFEGVYMDSKVYLNSLEVGGHVYGYTNFYVDLTGKLQEGKNILRVAVDNSHQPNSRWYTGSGIYRNVNLYKGGEKALSPNPVKITTLSINPPQVEISLRDEIEDSLCVKFVIRDGEKVVKEVVLPKGEKSIKTELTSCSLWSPESPKLYTLDTLLFDGDKELDHDFTRFGLRTIRWNSKEGFVLNEKTIKLYGACLHHDNGILGAASFDKAERRRVRKLKELGFNAIRSSHNPASKSLLDITDEEGMLVVDESFDQWKIPQTTYDYATVFDNEWKGDVRALITKDYNHPSVIMYGIGNEITDTGLPFGVALCKMINAEFHSLDSTRPTMLANNHMLTMLANMKAKAASGEKKGETTGSNEINNIVALLPKIMAETKAEELEAIAGEVFNSVDIVGYNYGFPLYKRTHELYPERVILSSETFPKRMKDNWKYVWNCDYIIGDFVWTAWDYLGEAGVGNPVYGTSVAPFSKSYPCLTASCANVDLLGFEEAQGLYNAVLWGAKKGPYIVVRPVEHSGEEYALGNWRLTDAIPSWTYPEMEGKNAEISVYGEGKYVALYKDGECVGKSELIDKKADFNIAYYPGTLLAITYDECDKEIARNSLVTAGKEPFVVIEPEESVVSNGEIVFVPITIRDQNGILKMDEDYVVNIEVKGDGCLLAFGSARCETEETFHSNEHLSYHGRCMAVVQSFNEKGTITIEATIEDKTAKTIIEVK